MPVLIYIFAVILAALSTAEGLTALAVVAATVAAALFFRHELRQLKLPTVNIRRTDP